MPGGVTLASSGLMTPPLGRPAGREFLGHGGVVGREFLGAVGW